MTAPTHPEYDTLNVLTGCAWIQVLNETTVEPQLSRKITVREALLEAHMIQGLDTSLNGVQFGATMRFLAAVAAVVIRHQEPRRPFQEFQGDRFDAKAVDAAIDELRPCTDLFHPEQPFLQLPPDPKKPSTDPVKKLLPYMPPDRAEDFWESSTQPEHLDLPEAVLALVVNYHYSFGGNNKLDGRACVNGSPGIRYPGEGYTATEVLWHGRTLFDSLCYSIPKDWVNGVGLPAWADPLARTALLDAPHAEHPLWRATWGSNTASCRWEGSRLIASSVGGSPYRPPLMGIEKHEAKAWWDLRNSQDPFYLYHSASSSDPKRTDVSSAPKPQRLDFGYTSTQLEAEWHSKNLSSALGQRSTDRAKRADEDTPLLFLRHLVEGSALSPVVRRSEVMISARSLWQISEIRADAVAAASGKVKAALQELRKPFSTKGKLGALADRRSDVEAEFWSEIQEPFNRFILNGPDRPYVDPQVWPEVLAASLRAFDTVVESVPHSKIAPKLSVARRRVGWQIAELFGMTNKQ